MNSLEMKSCLKHEGVEARLNEHDKKLDHHSTQICKLDDRMDHQQHSIDEKPSSKVLMWAFGLIFSAFIAFSGFRTKSAYENC